MLNFGGVSELEVANLHKNSFYEGHVWNILSLESRTHLE